MPTAANAALLRLVSVSMLAASTGMAIHGCSHSLRPPLMGLCRRELVVSAGAALGLAVPTPKAAHAFEAGNDEEVSGLVVLRIAEVCDFQERLLRSIAQCSLPSSKDLKDQFGNSYCEGDTYSVSPVQIAFGTGIMLKNSNLDGNLSLMIRTEVPRSERESAIRSATAIMNVFTKLANKAGEYTEFAPEDLLVFADIYADARQKLARFFDYLPEASKAKFYNYAEAVRKYEEKVSAEDGIARMKT